MDATITVADVFKSPVAIGPLPGPSPLRLLLVDDHELVRFGIRALHTEIAGVPIEWVEASSLQDGLAPYAQEGPFDAVLLDLNLPDCKGLQGLRRFLLAHPRARVAV